MEQMDEKKEININSNIPIINNIEDKNQKENQISNLTLDEVKNLFDIKILHFGIKIKKEMTQTFLNKLRDCTIKFRNVNPVTSKDDPEYNTILTKYEEKDKSLLKEYMTKNREKVNLKEGDYEIVVTEIKLDYNNFSYGEVLKKILPQGDIAEAPSSYEVIGKIAHLNLREKFLPYKKLIGELILDKTPALKTVINKTSKIDNVFRTYQMEVLAGEPSFEVEHKEGSCIFQFDIRKVYWCSRLQAERDRMLKKFKKGEVLCDAFCGVGPLAIRVAKAGYRVLGNDLNPDCYHYLNVNMKLNKISNKMLLPFNMDARDFIRAVINRSKEQDLDQVQNSEDNHIAIFNQIPADTKIHHFYMNLPKDALEFLDVFVGLFKNTKISIYSKDSLPTVHVYGFSNAKDPKEDILQRVATAFEIENFDIKYLVDFHNVRDVSNYKHMFCVSLKIPPEVAYK